MITDTLSVFGVGNSWILVVHPIPKSYIPKCMG